MDKWKVVASIRDDAKFDYMDFDHDFISHFILVTEGQPIHDFGYSNALFHTANALQIPYAHPLLFNANGPYLSKNNAVALFHYVVPDLITTDMLVNHLMNYADFKTNGIAGCILHLAGYTPDPQWTKGDVLALCVNVLELRLRTFTLFDNNAQDVYDMARIIKEEL